MLRKKTGFTSSICEGCIYHKNKRCTIKNMSSSRLLECPEGYTHELMEEISKEIKRRKRGLPHGDVFSRDW